MSTSNLPMRTIRSFVRRTGRITPSQRRALDELWPHFGIEYGASALHLDDVFGRNADRVVEIGFGDGDTLVQAAADCPETDFLGIEVYEAGVGHCLMAARNAGIENLRVISHDAIDVLNRQISKNALAGVNLFFPDPWPKKRHHKRRIIQEPFLGLLASRLEKGGIFQIATDWANYAEHIDEVLSADSNFELLKRVEHDGNQAIARYRTKFERRGLRKGHRISDWKLKRL